MTATSRPKSSKSRSAGRPTTEQSLEIENRILDVALKEFLDRGYGNASLERIVKVAGISKTTLYSRFSAKEELFRAVVSNQINRIDPGSYLKVNSNSHNLEEGLISFANKMLEFSLQGEMLGVNRLINSESSRFPELGAAAAERTRLGVERITKFIQECAASRSIPCKDPQSVAEVFILMIRGWYTNIMLTNQQVPPAKRKRWVEKSVRILLSDQDAW